MRSPYNQIPPADRELYHLAEAKEWAGWRANGSVRILSTQESEKVRQTTDPRRIIRLRFVYRDKNSSIRTPQTPLPIKAKARLCAQASGEPLAQAGLIKLDSPTVQRLGLMVFLQAMLNLEWTKTWRKGDVSSAFLQGKARDVEKLGRLFLEPPKRPLDGVPDGCLPTPHGLGSKNSPAIWSRNWGFSIPDWM